MATFIQLCEQNESGYLYHATFTEKVPSILKKGLRQFQDSNWLQAGTGERYNEDAGIFAFEHPEDALKWALKMEWEFKTDDLSIVRIKPTKQWEQDPSTDVNLQFGKGRSMRRLGNAPATDIIDVFPINQFGRPGPRGMSLDEWLADSAQNIS